MQDQPNLNPPALKPGDTIGVMAPSSFVEADALEKAAAFVEQHGYRVFIHPQSTSRHHQSAGPPEEKTDALHALFRDPEIKAIVAAGGGNRALHLLDRLDYGLIRDNPKIMMGFSDVTALLNGIYAQTGLVTFHGPVLKTLPSCEDDETLFALLGGQDVSYDLGQAEILKDATAEGRLIGGNLSILQALTGTPYEPPLDGAILFIEDSGDHISRYDRMLGQMRLAGWFDRISGLIAGEFTDTKDDPERPFGFSLADCLTEHLSGRDIPVLMNAPFGHGKRLAPLPVGCPARLQGKTLSLLDSCVR